MITNVTLVRVMGIVTKPFLFIKVDFNKKAFRRREIMTQQFS